MALRLRAAVAIAALVVTAQSCLFVKAPEQKVVVDNVALSPKPEIEMSDELVRTRTGDMIALLPKGWFFLDTKGHESSDIIAVAVNPEYTVSAVFASIPNSESSKEVLEKEGVLGLARVSFNKRARKTANATKLIGTYSTAELGLRRFGCYEFSTNGGSMRSRCAVFTSSIGNHYEFALVPLTVSGKDLLPDPEQQKIFRSILATVQY